MHFEQKPAGFPSFVTANGAGADVAAWSALGPARRVLFVKSRSTNSLLINAGARIRRGFVRANSVRWRIRVEYVQMAAVQGKLSTSYRFEYTYITRRHFSAVQIRHHDSAGWGRRVMRVRAIHAGAGAYCNT